MTFWNRYFLLYYSTAPIASLLLTYSLFSGLLLSFIGLWGPNRSHVISFYLIFFLFLIRTDHSSALDKNLPGIGYFEGRAITKSKKPLLIGKFVVFKNQDGSFYDVKSALIVNSFVDHPTNYVVRGYWKNNNFVATESREIWNLSLVRDHIKKYIKKRLCERFNKKDVVNLFSAILTGEIDDALFWKRFDRGGVSHLLVISGFHFSMITICWRVLFLSFFSRRKSAILLFFAVTTYFIFLGKTSSVFRAWIAASFHSLGIFFKRSFDPLDILGISIIISLIIDPHDICRMGFQLSYLATFGILTSYPLIKKLSPLKKRNISKLDLPNSIGYFILDLFDKAMVLNISVFIFVVPLLLYHQSHIFLSSFIFNCFVPFFLMISIVGFFISTLIGIDYIVESFTHSWIFVIFHSGMDSIVLYQKISLEEALLWIATMSIFILYKRDKFLLEKEIEVIDLTIMKKGV